MRSYLEQASNQPIYVAQMTSSPGSTRQSYTEDGITYSSFFGINFNEIQKVAYFNDTGSVVTATPGLVIAHEFAHRYWQMVGASSSKDPSDRAEDQNLPGFDYKGDIVKFQNKIALELGKDNEVRASYYGYASPDEFSTSLTDNHKVDIVRRSIPFMDTDTSLRSDASRDLLIGDETDNTMRSGAGNDYLWGFEGNDLLDGGSGDDRINGDEGHDVLIGREGDDRLFGDEGDDILDSGSGKNISIGGSGSDTFFANSGDDEIWGGDYDELSSEGLDLVDYSQAPQRIKIKLGVDGLSVEEGNFTDNLHAINIIKGTLKRDIFELSTNIIDSNDSLIIDANGGQGSSIRDTINTKSMKNGVLVEIGGDGSGSILDTETGGVVTLKNFHTDIIGSDDIDSIQDNSFGHKNIDGGAGSDVIIVANGSSTIYGGDGDDELIGGNENDVLLGGSGEDSLFGGGGHDLLIGGDSIFGQEVLDGGAGNDMLVVRGTAGTASGANNLVLRGGAGNDLYLSNATDVDAVSGPIIEFRRGDGHDEVLYSDIHGWGNDANIRRVDMTSLSNTDVMVVWDAKPTGQMGSNGRRYMSGDLAIVIKSTGDSVLFRDIQGWQGTHFGSYPTTVRSGNVTYGTISFDLPTEIDFAGEGYPNDILWVADGTLNVDMTIGSVSAYDRALSDWNSAVGSGNEITGTAGADAFQGSAGSESFDGGAGDDSFEGSEGNDEIDGGDGVDELNLFGSRSDYSISTNSEGSVVLTDTRTGSATTTKNIEQIYFAHDDETWVSSDLLPIIGTNEADMLVGTSGHNKILGLDGDDTLVGNEGDDILDGGAGIDTAFYQGTSTDYALGTASDGSVIAMSITAQREIDRLIDVELVQFNGDSIQYHVSNLATPSNGSGFVYGTSDNDITYFDFSSMGSDGDSAYGGDGFDIIYLDKDVSVASIYNVSSGTNISIYNASGISLYGYEAIYVAATGEFVSISSIPNFGSESSDTIIGTSRNNILYGQGGDDILRGLAGDDSLRGGAGNDVLWGGLGDDYISGGSGNDIFLYNKGEGRDLIEAWSPSDTEGYDELHLGDGITAATTTVTRLGDTARLQFDTFGSIVDLSGIFGPSSGVVELIRFKNGTTWDVYDLQVKSGGADQKLIGTVGDDLVIGNAGQRDILIGLDGNDTLMGLSGADTLLGNAGSDFLTGGQGDDILDGGDGNDQAAFSGKFEDYIFNRVGERISITDTRSGQNDGTDSIRNVESFFFEEDGVTRSLQDIFDNTNSAPEMVEDLGAIGMSNYSSYDFSGHFFDADDDLLTFSVTMSDGSSAPDWMYMLDGELYVEMPEDFYDPLEVTVWASDGQAMVGDTLELYIYV